VRIARLKHAGDWDVCRTSAARLATVLAESLSMGLDAGSVVNASASAGIDPSMSLVWMTGTVPAKLTAIQKSKIKAYLVGGGTIFIDSAMGTDALLADAKASLEEMFGKTSVREMPSDHPLLTGAFGGGLGCDLAKPGYTRAVGPGRSGPPKLLYVEIDGRAAAVLSPLSVVAPLQGQPLFGCKGLASPDAARLAANVLLYALTAGRE
jgi:hypothetical protein